MNFGTELYTWFSTQAQPLVWLALIFLGLNVIFKREITKLVGLLILALVVVLLVFNAAGVASVLLNLGNKIIGA